MVHIEGEIVINRPVETVFDSVADQRNEPRYNPSMIRAEKVSEGPISVGTRFQAETSGMGRTYKMAIEITVYERPRRLASSSHMSAMDIQGTLTFAPLGEKTRMRWSWHVQPRGIFKLMTPLIGLMGKRQEERIWRSLKRHLETREMLVQD